MYDKENRFHFEINSFADFLQFIAIIREEEIDLEKISKVTEKINQKADELKTAVDANKPK